MIRIDLQSPELTTALKQLGQRLDNLTPALRNIGELLVTTTQRRFTTQKAPDGTAWAPNSPVTLERFLSKSYGGDVPRKRDGSLKAPAARRLAGKKPLSGETGELQDRIAATVSGNTLGISSSKIYGGVQQFGAKQGAFGRTRRGSPIPWGDIPARPFIGISDSDRQGIAETIAEHLEGSG